MLGAEQRRADPRSTIRSPLQEVELQRSYHVATLDYDAQRIFDESVEFIESLEPGLTGLR